MRCLTAVRGVDKALRECLSLRPGESLGIITDLKLCDLAELFVAQAIALGAEAVMGTMVPRLQHGEEPPAPIASMMKSCDALVLLTSMSLSHTSARREATEGGVRIASMPGLREEMLSDGAMTADFHEVARRCRLVAQALAGASELKVVTPRGTELVMSIRGRKVFEDTGFLGEPGSFGNLPAGEVFVAPVEESVNGTLVLEWWQGDLAADPITLQVEQGRVVHISSPGSAGGQLERQLRSLEDPGAWVVCEFGVGTNDKAKFLDHPLEAEKMLGTVHIALGDNHAIGGSNRARIHWDFVLTSPTVVVDGERVILEHGSLKLPGQAGVS